MIRTSNYVLTVLVGALLIAGTIAGSYVTYQNQQDKIKNLQQQVTSLKIDLKTAQSNLQGSSSSTQTLGKSYTSAKGVKIYVYRPVQNTIVTSPIAVLGEVPGNWSSEATFPVTLKDSSGKVIAQASAQVLGEWMTDQLVPFSAKLTFTDHQAQIGTLTLHKDNPSGNSANDDSVSIPIRFDH